MNPQEAMRFGVRALNERTEAQALPVIMEMVRRHPDEPGLGHLLGLLHFELGRHEPAFEALDAALALKPDDAKLVHARARMALETGLPSLEWFERAHRLAPDDASVLLGRVASLVAAGGADQADHDLTALLRQHPGWMEGHAALMRLRFSLGRAADWLADLDHALARHPADPRLHHLKIIALHRADRGDEALEAASLALSVAGQVTQVRVAAAIAAAEHGPLDQAAAAFEGLDKTADQDAALHWCRLLVRRGAWQEVVDFAQGAPRGTVPVLMPYVSIATRKLHGDRDDPLGETAFVKVIDFGADWPPLAELTDTLRALHLTHAHPLDQSVRGGTQTDGPLLKRAEPAIRHLRERFLAEVQTHIGSMPGRDVRHPFLGRMPRTPRFSGSWSVRIRDGGHHEPHVHDQGWLSSVFYVRVATQEARDKGYLTLGEPQRSLETGLSPMLKVEPVEGRLVLFPSNLWHGTQDFKGEERLTVAFDIA